jgi:hypothetical protein
MTKDKNILKLQDYLRAKKKQLVSVALPTKTYIELKKESSNKQKTIQSIIRQRLEEHSNDDITNEFILKKIEKLINDVKTQKN